jgi:hypothetical protein
MASWPVAPNLTGMSLSPEPAPKPKMTAEERRARQADRLKAIRLRMAIWRKMEDRGTTTPAQIGAAVGMLPAEAYSLLTRRQWREGDVALLEAAAARLRVKVPDHTQLVS